MHRALNDILWSANASQLQPQSRREKPQSHLKQPQSHHDSSLTTTDSAGQSRELGLTIDASSNNLAEEVSRLRELILTLKDEARTASQQSEASHRQTHSNQDAAAAQLTSALQTMREENHREQREAAEASRQALQDALGSARPADVQPLQEQLREADRLLAILNEMMALRKKEDAQAEVTQQTVVDRVRDVLQEEFASHQVGLEADAAAAARKPLLQSKGAGQLRGRGAPAMPRRPVSARGGGSGTSLPRVATLGRGGARGGASRSGPAAAAAASASSRAPRAVPPRAMPPRNRGVPPPQLDAAARGAAALGAAARGAAARGAAPQQQRYMPAQPQRYEPTITAPPLGYAAPSEYPGPSQQSPHEMLGPPSEHGGTSDANGALGGSFNTSGYSNLELPAEEPRAASAQNILERAAAATARRGAAKLAAANCEASRAAAAASGAKVAASGAADENRRPNGQCPNPNLFERSSTRFSR